LASLSDFMGSSFELRQRFCAERRAIAVPTVFRLADGRPTVHPISNDEEVTRFADSASLEGSADDGNAKSWSAADNSGQHGTIEGNWSCRWTAVRTHIPGDAAHKWKQGRGQARITEERIYLLFDWDSGARQGLIDARREGPHGWSGSISI